MPCRRFLSLLVLLASLTTSSCGNPLMAAESSSGKMLAHNVYFSVKEPAGKAKLIAACKKYLTNHPGVVYFGTGAVSDLDRPINDRDWDVGLHLVFESQAAHDRYQTSPRHEQFVAENKDLWSKVRVFDTDVEGK